MIEIGIDSEILNAIRDGRKTVEGRLKRGKFLHVAVGDVISIREDFYENGSIARSVADSLRIVVDDVQEFESFHAMLEEVGYSKVIPDAMSLADAVAKYHQYYSIEDERQFGIVGIYFRIELIPATV